MNIGINKKKKKNNNKYLTKKMENRNEEKALELSQDFNDYIDDIKLIPHKIGFAKDYVEKNIHNKNIDNNNCFNASLHCLTNITILSKFILKQNYKENKYIDLISKLEEDKDINQKKEYINDCLQDLREYLKEKKYKFKEKGNEDPRKLIEFLLNDLPQNSLPNEIKSIFLKKCNSCKYINGNLELNIIKFDIPEIIKNNNNKQLKIYDCFDFYFKSLNCDKCHHKNIDITIKLPKIIIIFIDYGKDNNCFYDISYEFDENIKFGNDKFLKDEDKNNQYFLYSIIVGKNIGTEFELFYTFALEDYKKNKYILYNGNEFHSKHKVSKYLKKKEIDFKNKKESFPFVLVYIEKNYAFL